MLPYLRPAAGRRGHTLIEMLTVLVLIMVIASLAAPSMSSYVTRTKTRRALDRVANDIAFARMAAVRAGTPAIVDFSSATAYTVEIQTDPPSVVRRVLLANEFAGVRLTPPNADGELVFDSRGLLRTTDLGAIIATAGQSSDSAVITAAGRVYRAY